MEKIKKVGEEEEKNKKNREGRSWKKKRRLVYARMFLAGVHQTTGGVFSSYNGRAEPEGSAAK